MKTTLLLTTLIAAGAHAGEPAATLQAQPLALAPMGKSNVKITAAGEPVFSPKIHETVATRNSDGTLSIGCDERPNPRAGKPPINTVSPEPQQ